MIKGHSELIVLDFDHTLFNTTAYLDVLIKHFKDKFGIESDEFLEEREAVKACCVVEDIDKFVGRLSHEDKPAMHQAMLDVIEQHAAEFTYSDANDFIKRHQADFDIMFLTHGDDELQRTKIKHCGLPQDVPFVITQGDKADELAPYVKRYKRVHFIDDKADNIDRVKEKWPDVVAYFMKRPGDAPYGDESTKCECADQEVSDLSFDIKKALHESDGSGKV